MNKEKDQQIEKEKPTRGNDAYLRAWDKRKLKANAIEILDLKEVSKKQKKDLKQTTKELSELKLREDLRKFLIPKLTDKEPLKDFEKGLSKAIKSIHNFRAIYKNEYDNIGQEIKAMQDKDRERKEHDKQ